MTVWVDWAVLLYVVFPEGFCRIETTSDLVPKAGIEDLEAVDGMYLMCHI